TTVQLLSVLPGLARLQPAPDRDGEAEQPAPGVELAAAGRREPVHQVAAGRVALGEQHRPGPDGCQRHAGGGAPGCARGCRVRDERHRQRAPPGVAPPAVGVGCGLPWLPAGGVPELDGVLAGGDGADTGGAAPRPAGSTAMLTLPLAALQATAPAAPG